MSRELKRAENVFGRWQQRRGVIVVLTAFLLTVLFAFLALSVDTGRVVLTETEMQNAVRCGFAGRVAGNSGSRLRRRSGRWLGHDRRQLDRRRSGARHGGRSG